MLRNVAFTEYLNDRTFKLTVVFRHLGSGFELWYPVFFSSSFFPPGQVLLKNGVDLLLIF